MTQQEVVEPAQQPQGDAMVEAAAEALKGLGGAPAEAAPEQDDEHPKAEAKGAEAEDEESPQDAYLRRHIPATAIRKMTLAERYEAYHELRERELGELRGRGRAAKASDSPSETPEAPRESTAARPPALSDAALSEALQSIEKLSTDNALEGFGPALSKPFQVVAQGVNALGAENQALRKELLGLGSAVQSLLTDRALDGLQLEGSDREAVEKELVRQLGVESDKGLKGLKAAADRARRLVLGSPAASPSGKSKADTKRKGQPTAPTGRSSGDTTKPKSTEDIARESIAKFLPHLS